MATQRKQEPAPVIPPDADPGVPPEAFAQIMANPPTKEQEAEWLEDIRRMRRDNLYLDSIKERILAERGDCWIAAYKEEVVAMADTWQELHDILDVSAVPKGKSVRRRFQRSPEPMILGLPQWR